MWRLKKQDMKFGCRTEKKIFNNGTHHFGFLREAIFFRVSSTYV